MTNKYPNIAHYTCDYTNWRGETRRRYFVPKKIKFESTEWHPKKQFILEAVDLEKGELRGFAMKEFNRDTVEVFYPTAGD